MSDAANSESAWDRIQVPSVDLQSQLIRESTRLGLEHRIGSEGEVTIRRSPHVEALLEKVSDTLFPDGWYSAVVPDSQKLARYRNFTRRHGTPIIEATVRGEPRVIQAARKKLYRTRAFPTHCAYIVTGTELSPDTVTQRLGVNPTYACSKGDHFARPLSSRRPDAPSRLSSRGWWELNSTPYVESNNVDDHLTWLFAQLAGLEQLLKEPKSIDKAVESRVVTIDLVRWADFGGLTFDSHTLAHLSAFADRVDVGLWTDEFMSRQVDH